MVGFEQIMQRLTPQLKGIAHKVYAYTPAVSADDLFQEAVLHLWQAYGQGSLEGNTDSYILQGCYFHLKNFVRMIKGRNRLVSLDEQLAQEKGDVQPCLWKREREAAADQLEYLDNRMLADVIRNNGLTPREKELLPFLSQGLTTREIGGRLGVSHVSVVKMTRAIRAKCLQYLDQ